MIDVVDKQRQGLEPRLKSIVDREPAEDGDYLVCGTCSHVVARQSDRIEVNGGHDHRFTNPYGLQFHLGCFREALGCAISGDPVAADTWFPGFCWRIASCEECRRHLGWYFDRDDVYFYGLVLDYIQNA